MKGRVLIQVYYHIDDILSANLKTETTNNISFE